MTTLKPASEKLLRTIAQHDQGDGVPFEWLPRGRYRLVGTSYIVSQRTFYPLTGNGLVTDSGSDDAPVRITEAGRQCIAQHQPRRRVVTAETSPPV
ncbi:hypothetical protein ACWDSL_06680 [Streptomyces sp. NPDC000941]